MKRTKKVLSIILAVCLLSYCVVPALAGEQKYTHEWENECKTECHGTCGTNPVIVVPGIMQSQVYVQDEDGNDLLTEDGFPIVEGMDMAFMFDTVALKKEFKNSIKDILLSVAKLDRDGLFDIVLGILDNSFKSHYFNPDGTRVNGVSVDEYWYSLAECAKKPEKSYGYAKGYKTDDDGNTLPTTKYETELDFIIHQVDISSFCDKYGYDHAYYFSYSSFGDIIASAQALNEYVQMVKAQTGHDKVDMVFISLGGTIGNVYLSDYCNPDDIDRVVFAAAATDGSYLLSDLMDGASTLEDTAVIYSELIPNILSIAAEEYTALGYLGNALARAIPEEVFNDFLNEALTRAVNECLGKLLRNCQSMWALVPSEVYPELSAKYISDEEHTLLKEKTDHYYEIQKNAGATMQKRTAEGVTIFVICGYDLELPALVEHYKLSADNIIQSTSTSVGGTFADVGSVLGEDYTPAIDETYLSPDGIVDAGTCALPDRTWFIKGQSHLHLQSSVNDVIEMCVQLMVDKSITDARENNGGYPQFNEYRDLSTVEALVKKYNAAKEDGVLDTLSESDKTAVDTAYDKAVALLESRVWSSDETKEVEKEFKEAMVSAGLDSESFEESTLLKFYIMPVLEKIFKFVSKVLGWLYGKYSYIKIW